MELGNITPCGPLSINTETKTDLIQMAYYPADSCAISPLTFLFIYYASVIVYTWPAILRFRYLFFLLC